VERPFEKHPDFGGGEGFGVNSTYKRRVLGARVTVIALFLVFLEVAPRAGWVDSLTLVPLSDMFRQLGKDLASGDTLHNVASTGSIILIALALAVVTGIVAGYLVWRYEWLRKAVDPYLASYYALPIFAFYPVLVSIFGLNRTPIVIVAWAYSTVSIITNTVIGLDSVKDVYLKAAQVYGLTRTQTLRQIQLPAAAGPVFTGLKLAVTNCVTAVIASEFLLATQGLGWLVAFNYNSFQLREMYSSIILVIAVAVVLATLVSLAERRAYRGRGA
jgi:NitT/TauT family transport system permease protein